MGKPKPLVHESTRTLSQLAYDLYVVRCRIDTIKRELPWATKVYAEQLRGFLSKYHQETISILDKLNNGVIR